jgi:16S rRNA (guanine966-N2)-methyltransferase
VRETLFNWLQMDIIGSRCLDMFAGSGALGLEAASRGASGVVMLESNPQVVSALKSYILILGFSDRVQVQKVNALEWNSPHDVQFDIVFLDPPFNQAMLQPAIEVLTSNHLLAKDSLVYVEQNHAEASPDFPGNWRESKIKRAGQVSYRLFRVE